MAIQYYDVNKLDPQLMTGPFRLHSGPTRMRSVTPGTAYGEFATYLYAGVTGDVSIVEWDGTTIIIPALTAGVWHRMSSVMVNTSGTTATGLIWGS